MIAPRRPTKAACREAEDALLVGAADGDPTARVRVDRHLGHCPACQAIKQTLQQTRADLRAAAAPLDDVHRARLLARLAPAIDEQASRQAAVAARRSQPSGARSLRWIGTAGALATAAVAAALVAGLHRAPAPYPRATDAIVIRQTPATTTIDGSATAAGQPPAAPAAPSPAPALIVPYRVIAEHGAASGRLRREARARHDRLVDQSFQRLQTPPDTTIRARVGERMRVTLVGGTDVSILSAVDDVLDVGLDAGTLVADFVHRRTGRLRIHSPGAVTEVVGTLFSVEVRGQQSRVSVAHGRVVVQPSDGPPRVVSAGQSWISGTPHVEDVPAQTAALLAEHDAAIRPPAPAPAPWTITPSFVPVAQPAPAFEPAPVAVAAIPAAPVKPAAVVAIVQPRALIAAPAAPEAIYRDAESAMRRRDWLAAQRALERLVGEGAHGALPDVARYELAQLAIRNGDDARAARWLDALLTSNGEPALREPARFLRCELRGRASDAAEARRCWEDFRRGFPTSGRDAPALGRLLRLSGPGAACGALSDEYLRRYPDGPDAALARQRKATCEP